ncbi:hypothetical protein [Streptomyces cyaneogriseus]|nr:hypothetical protein [Streptomyces cyaneogriseus]
MGEARQCAPARRHPGRSGVITSYSIHYTKLYERRPVARAA